MPACFTPSRPASAKPKPRNWHICAFVRASGPLLCAALALGGCTRVRKAVVSEDVYVIAKQAYLRDRIAAVSNRTGEVSNGQKLQVLGHQRRFLKVRTPSGQEGWIEEKLTADQGVADQFETLAHAHVQDRVVATAVTRDEVYLHLTPGRETVHFFRLPENDSLSLLERASVPKSAAPGNGTGAAASAGLPSAAKLPVRDSGTAHSLLPESGAGAGQGTPIASAEASSTSAAAAGPPQPVMEDWWLVRDKEGQTGWIYARMIDVSEPDTLARYAEGQRIVGAYILTYVDDPESNIVKDGQPVTRIPEYVTVLSPFKAGLPYDFDQLRVFIWNAKKHRYETAYRERNIAGYLPVGIGMKSDPYNKDPHFAGALPTFTVRVLPANAVLPAPDPATGLVHPKGTIDDSIRLVGNVCRRIAPPNAPPLALLHPNPEPQKADKGKGRQRR